MNDYDNVYDHNHYQDYIDTPTHLLLESKLKLK